MGSTQSPLSIKSIFTYKVKSREKSNIIPFGYLSLKLNPASFYVLYGAKAIFPRNFSCRYEIVIKSSENLLSLGHLHNHHKFL